MCKKCNHSNTNAFPAASLAALIAFFLLIFGRCRGTQYSVLVILAVLIICGCSMYRR